MSKVENRRRVFAVAAVFAIMAVCAMSLIPTMSEADTASTFWESTTDDDTAVYHTVTFYDKHGYVLNTQSVKDGESAHKLDEPSKVRYTYYSDSAMYSGYGFGAVTKDTSVFVKSEKLLVGDFTFAETLGILLIIIGLLGIPCAYFLGWFFPVGASTLLIIIGLISYFWTTILSYL